MKRTEVYEIVGCLPRGRTLFHDFPDRYALWLLARAIGTTAEIRALKAGRFARLLDRRAAREVVARSGGRLSAAALDAAWPPRWRTYRLTVGRWGHDGRRWRYRGLHQTTRPGWNLVLQLNFSEEHNRAYRRLIADHAAQPFEYSGHPIARGRGLTLAWSRLDIDLDRGEALIEELQNDWLRKAQRRAAGSRLVLAREDDFDAAAVARAAATLDYLSDVLAPHRKVWDQALLLATLMFLREELGLRRIWLHHWSCGAALKQIWGGREPPVSLYKTLPARFCFQETAEAPGFLAADPPPVLRRLERTGRLRFWRLDL